jgi:SAM-dependent methyltransferase
MPKETIDNMSYWLLRAEFVHWLSRRSRQAKLQLLQKEIGNDPAKRVLDVGAGGEWEHAENTLEKYYPYPERIVAVSLEEGIHGLKQKYRAVRWVLGNGLNLPFEDKAFDIAYSNAVIEHVIGDHFRRQLVAEMLRVARCCLITTPNALFPVELHSRLPIVHWLPDKWHNWITKRLGMGFIAKGIGGYFDPITPSQLRGYFPAGMRVRVHLGWLGMTLMAICDQGK